VFSLASAEFIGPFQEHIRARYPQASQNNVLHFQVPLPGIETPAAINRQVTEFKFEDEAHQWRVSLGIDFLSLDTEVYGNRDLFLARLEEPLRALEACIRPSHCTRVGIRYVDRIKDAGLLEQVPALFRPEMLGLASSGDMVGQVSQVFAEALMTTREGKLLVRSGRLPANSTHDPVLIPPLASDTWILDLDSFSTEQKPFQSETVLEDARALAERAYTFFQWSITKTFIENFG
jgi:uncharacterized protein (TIGR04255 family)